jgi:uncharacterized membrane protein
MEDLLTILEDNFTIVVEYLILFVEFVGVLVVVGAIIKGIIDAIKKDEHMRLNLVEGIALAMSFKIGGELLRTVIVRNWDEILLLGAVILLRAALTFYIQWEIRIEKKKKEERERIVETVSESE